MMMSLVIDEYTDELINYPYLAKYFFSYVFYANGMFNLRITDPHYGNKLGKGIK